MNRTISFGLAAAMAACGSDDPSEDPSEAPSAPATTQSVAAVPAAPTQAVPDVGVTPSPADPAETAGGSGAVQPIGEPVVTGPQPPANFPFPRRIESEYCRYPDVDASVVQSAYDLWKETVITSEGAGDFLRVRKPDSGTVIDSTVSEGIGYGMLLAVYMNDPEVFDNLWKYAKQYFNGNGLMNWEVGPDGQLTAVGTGAATDGDEDMAWALVMADRQWGGQGTLDDTYLNEAVTLINNIWAHEVDPSRNYMLKAGDSWGDVDVTNPSYFAPAYYRVFGEVTGRTEDWNLVIDESYAIIERSLNAASGNQDNGLVPAWCDSAGTPIEAYPGAPTHFQNDSTRTPFRVAQDYCYYGEPRAKAYLDKINGFYTALGALQIVDGYNLDGSPRPERSTNGLQAASFVGPAAVAATAEPAYQLFVSEGTQALATLELTAGTIYYQKSWTALSLLMLGGNFADLTRL